MKEKTFFLNLVLCFEKFVSMPIFKLQHAIPVPEFEIEIMSNVIILILKHMCLTYYIFKCQ